jgi:hypothetical protein
MKKKLATIVPFRNREEHLKIFIDEIKKWIKDDDIVLIVEQDNLKPFNRAKLFNVGFLHLKDFYDYFCFHDVDMIPIEGDYSFPEHPIHMPSKISEYNNSLPYENYYGGVNIFNKEDFLKINGFSNEFWGWGGEDDDLFKRITHYGYELRRRNCSYFSLPHIKSGSNHPNYKDNTNKLQKEYDYQKDGLNTTIWKKNEEVFLDKKIILLKVNI